MERIYSVCDGNALNMAGESQPATPTHINAIESHIFTWILFFSRKISSFFILLWFPLCTKMAYVFRVWMKSPNLFRTNLNNLSTSLSRREKFNVVYSRWKSIHTNLLHSIPFWCQFNTEFQIADYRYYLGFTQIYFQNWILHNWMPF